MKKFKNKKSTERKNKITFGKIWKAIVEFRSLVIGIVALIVAVFLHLLVFEDWWAIIYAIVESIVFFIFIEREQGLSLRDNIACTLVCFAVFAIATPLFGTGLGWHLLGNIAGLIVLLVITCLKWYVDEFIFPEFIAPYGLTLLVLFVAQAISVCINEVEKEKQLDIHYDKLINEAPYYQVKEVLSFVKNGDSYYVIVTENDTIYLSINDYPKSMFIDTTYYVSCLKKEDGSVIKLKIKGEACP